MNEKQRIESKDVGSLEEALGLNDPLFQPEPKQNDSEQNIRLIETLKKQRDVLLDACKAALADTIKGELVSQVMLEDAIAKAEKQG